ncbi:protein required for normal CLN1 and CLN2 G1 cyclin expression [Scheffersomyces coipomensis]|uniref:protein required for normal CLN1 and CLN2 G1 cyclin expression n=1 Tax=Scheffersomyces coipomensis TaxID=1788519 RepID=UPI00315D01D4
MAEPVDISFYIGEQAAEAINLLEIPVESGSQIVTLNLPEDLTEDINDVTTFLAGEKTAKKYWISLAAACVKASRLDDALKVIEQAQKLEYFSDEDRKSFQAFSTWLYFKYVSSGIDKENNLINAGNAISNLAQRIKTDKSTATSNSTSNLLAQAVLLQFSNREEEASDIFERILRIDQNNCFALLGKAQIILSKSKNYSQALKIFQQVLILNPLMKPDPRIGIGLCFWLLKDEGMAIKSWERALEFDSSNLKAKILLNLAKFHKCFNNSLSDEEFLQNYKTCLTELSQNYKQLPNDAVILLALVSYYFSKGDLEVSENLVKKAIKSITGDENAIKFNTFNRVSKYQSNVLSQCATWYGRISFEKSDFTQASKFFQEAIKLNESNLVAKLGLGQSQYNRGSIEEAVMTYESILRSNMDCLEVNYSLGILYSRQKSKRKQEQAIQILERYLRLSDNRGLSSTSQDKKLASLNKEPVALNAYLVLSKLYESKDVNQSLQYLQKAIEIRKLINKDVPLEVYNNIGVFNFARQNYEVAATNFQAALDNLESTEEDFKSADGDVLPDLKSDLKITLSYNLARSSEVSNQDEAIQAYEKLLQECPHYFSAKIRVLFLNCISGDKYTKEEIKTEIDNLLEVSASDLEIRSFYGWFVKSFGKKVGLKPEADTNHQKDTLVKYDSHDSYALLSLANIYCIMARDAKSNQTSDDKKKKYYVRAIELFAKVLSVDPKNVYAAQGLAITYIENKEPEKGLEILRKIRDSLTDISIYLNLGHALIETKDFGKAIESYEIALGKFTNGKDTRILSFLGRAWYLRGNAEKNLSYFKKAYEYSKEVLEISANKNSSFKFNLAYVQFQIAEFITKLPISKRKVDEIEDAIIGLKEAIETLNSLASEEEKYAPYPKPDLKARANLGTTTLLNRLNAALEETIDSIAEIDEKLEEAKKVRKEAEDARLKEEQERLEIVKKKEEELAKERAILQEQAQQWAEESRMNVIVNEDDDDKLFNEESAAKGEKKRGSRGGKKEGKGKRRGKKKVIEDSEDEASATDSDIETNGKRKIKDDDEDEVVGPSSKRKKKALSKEFIEDSDDELDDDLFDEKNDEESSQEHEVDADPAEDEK